MTGTTTICNADGVGISVEDSGATATFANLSNSSLAGAGNAAAVFSCTDLGGNTGTILFNGGANTCP